MTSCTIAAQVAAGSPPAPALSASTCPAASFELSPPADMIRSAHAAIIDEVGELAALALPAVERATAELLPELDRIAADLSAASLASAPDAALQYLHFELHLNRPALVDLPVSLALGHGAELGGACGPNWPEASFNGGRSWQPMPELVLPAGTRSVRLRMSLVPALPVVHAERSTQTEPRDVVQAIRLLRTGGEPAIVGQLLPAAAGAGGFLRQDEVPGCYGWFSVDADGRYAYRLNQDAPEVHDLRTGQSLTECFDVPGSDGTQHDLLITVLGAQDGLLVHGIQIHQPTLLAA